MTADILELVQERVYWLPIQSLNEKTTEMPPYPVKALPSIIQKAILAYQAYGQQPLPLIACSALANVSLSCQTLANVARDHLLISPVSLYFLIVAQSGERKSCSDHVFGQAIKDWERKVTSKLSPKIQAAKVAHKAWQVERDAILSQIRKATIQGEDTAEFKDQYIDIMDEEPEIPLMPMLFFEDTTQEAITSQMAHGWPSASLWSDEGGIVLSNQGMQNNATKFIATLNLMWDGKPFNTHRKTSKSFSMAHRRLTVSLMLQPLILQQLITRGNGLSRQSGFLARSLITFPESSMGERYYQEPPKSLKFLYDFNERIASCLNHSLSLDSNGCEKIPTLTFSDKAKKVWVKFFDNIENGLIDPARWLTIKDFASKAAENVARLAALFHLFEGRKGEIEVDLIEQAQQIIEWHLWETKRILGTTIQSPEQQDAGRILQWLQEKVMHETTARNIQQYGPIREKSQRDSAIKQLIEANYLQEMRRGSKTILLVNPIIYKVRP